jgi:ATP-dependent Lon protease
MTNEDLENTKQEESLEKDFQSLAKALKNKIDEPIKNKRLIMDAVPIREGVLFPSTESVLTFGRTLSLNAIKNIGTKSKTVVLITQKNPDVENPKEKDLYKIGTLASVEKKLKTSDNTNALVKGMGRVKIVKFISTSPKIVVEVEHLQDIDENNNETKALVSHLQKEFRKAVHMGKPVEFLNFMKLMGGVTNGELVDQIASTLSIKTHEKQEVLETLSVQRRLNLVIKHLTHEMKILEIEKDVVHKTQEKFDKSMRENILRERLRTIQKELGDIDDEEEAADNYQGKLKNLEIKSELKKRIKKEIKRLRMMSPNNPEAGYVRSWLDTIFELPWGKHSKAKLDIKKAQEVLDKDHFGLEEVKDRILEYIAVLSLKQKNKKKEDRALPTILCFVGPPGVGKTSIGRSIAESLGRKFIKISLGGVRDEAEIRGHRRTYVGAMPGKIISGMKQAKSMNPVFMLDEIDKIGSDYKGDPSSALLETLDPEQNSEFQDHYLDMPFDLSQVIFITTANTLDTIPPALKDRLEIIRYSGYTMEEKFHIAKDYLVKKVLKANGLTKKQIKFSDEAINIVIGRYTREAGVRSLERTISSILRKAAREIITNAKKKSIDVNKKTVREYLGPEKFDVNLTEKDDIVGQATGLAWTSVGGEILFIEVALTPGKGLIRLTGKLGDVMKESAQAAYTYTKANYKALGISLDKLRKNDVHIHVPEGAIPKDGPSAGVTMTTAIVSAFTSRAVRRDIAMTGEVTLRGRVLRIGGLKEKSIAAHMAGSKTVLIPKDNERDIEKIPDSVKKDITFIPVSNVSEVLKMSLV